MVVEPRGDTVRAQEGAKGSRARTTGGNRASRRLPNSSGVYARACALVSWYVVVLFYFPPHRLFHSCPVQDLQKSRSPCEGAWVYSNVRGMRPTGLMPNAVHPPRLFHHHHARHHQLLLFYISTKKQRCLGCSILPTPYSNAHQLGDHRESHVSVGYFPLCIHSHGVHPSRNRIIQTYPREAIPSPNPCTVRVVVYASVLANHPCVYCSSRTLSGYRRNGCLVYDDCQRMD